MGISDYHTCVGMPDKSFNCWNACSAKDGACDACGARGMCCRIGHSGGGCDGKTHGIAGFHTCVVAGGGSSSSSKNAASANLTIIIPVVVAAILLVAAVLCLVRKRAVAAKQSHRASSMPDLGGKDEAEAA